MDAKYKITIPKLCHEDWNTMTPDETGRFCGSCIKSVVDFTKMNASEIQDYFTKNQGKSVCGRFKNEQVNTFNLEIPQSILNQKMPFRKAFLLMLFVVMGSSLFSCRNNEGGKLGEVAIVNDTIIENPTVNENVTVGAPRVDTDFQNEIPSPKPKEDEVKFVKEPSSKGKAKDGHTKSENSPKEIITMGLVSPPKAQDSIRIEKK